MFGCHIGHSGRFSRSGWDHPAPERPVARWRMVGMQTSDCEHFGREQEELLAATGEWRSLNYTITPDGPLHPRASSLSTIEGTGGCRIVHIAHASGVQSSNTWQEVIWSCSSKVISGRREWRYYERWGTLVGVVDPWRAGQHRGWKPPGRSTLEIHWVFPIAFVFESLINACARDSVATPIWTN